MTEPHVPLLANEDTMLDEQTARALRDFKATVFAMMKTYSVNSLTVSYSGCGDSGEIDEITVDPPLSNHHMFLIDVPVWSRDAAPMKSVTFTSFEELAVYLTEYLIAIYHDGYENNEGGSGLVVADRLADTITYERSDNYVTQTTEHVAL